MITKTDFGVLLGLTLGMLISPLFDHALAQWATQLPPDFAKVAQILAFCGRAVWVLIPSLLLALIFGILARRNPHYFRIARQSFFVFLFVAICGIVANCLKEMIGRPRPYVWLKDPAILPHPFAFQTQFASFPSGHTNTAMALALSLGTIFPKARIPLFAWAVLMGFSRIVLDAHYLSDVLGGALVSALLFVFLRKPFFDG